MIQNPAKTTSLPPLHVIFAPTPCSGDCQIRRFLCSSTAMAVLIWDWSMLHERMKNIIQWIGLRATLQKKQLIFNLQ